MDFLEIGENCRICLCDFAIVNWDEEIFELCGMTYKDCYFKYTQLEEIDPDPFSSRLCKKCSEDLKNAHFLIENALESFRVLKHAYNTDSLIDEELKDDLSSSICTTSRQEESEVFEICLISQSHESLIDIENNDGNNFGKVIDFETTEADYTKDMDTVLDGIPKSLTNQDCPFTQEDTAGNSELKKCHQENKSEETLNCRKAIKSRATLRTQKENKGKEISNIKNITLRSRTSKRKRNEEDDPDKEKNVSQSLYSPSRDQKKKRRDTETLSSPSGEQKKKTKKTGPLMCSYCSQILIDIYSLKNHEAIHDKNRERKEVCSNCGLRFYTKTSLRSHMLTHEKNRKKPYKCEFCEKSYFNRGALNVHRRIHLGLMVKCTLCPKEFCREIDLEYHLSTHSIVIPNQKTKTPTFLVHCRECDSQIPSRRWTAHQAAHRNEPQVKCTICDRDFYSRKNCTKHINKIHNKTREEYDKYMHYYVEKMRMSHLMLQQTVEIIKK